VMPCKYVALDGSSRVLDLDQVVDVVKGPSGRRSDWEALVVYDAGTGAFVELRDAPQDFKGNSEDHAEEVTEQYVCESFGIAAEELKGMRKAPRKWTLIELRD
jgi:hypothetical protein